MALLASAVFAFAFIVSFGAIVGTLLPARHRVLHLLRNGPDAVADPLPSVRLTSRRGVIRQRAVMVGATPLRAAA